jgi:hypothetical protein
LISSAVASTAHLHGESAPKQQNLIITLPNEPRITVDNIEVARFVYLLPDNRKIRLLTPKGVLLPDRFMEQA